MLAACRNCNAAVPAVEDSTSSALGTFTFPGYLAEALDEEMYTGTDAELADSILLSLIHISEPTRPY